MESLTIHPKTKVQINALKTLFKEMNIPFEKTKEKTYNAEWVETMRKSEKDEKEGKIKAIKLDELWK
jgi:antitoxin component of RelBE/YafQ-DinJ toxin-antitoxin module